MNTNLAQVIDINTKKDGTNYRFMAQEFINSLGSKQTKRSYTADLKDFFKVDDLNLINVHMIKRTKYPLIQEYVSNMVDKKYKKSTIQRRVGCLRSFFNYCASDKENIIDNNPLIDERLKRMLKNKLPKNEKFLGTVLSVPQIKELYNDINEPKKENLNSLDLHLRDLDLIKMILRTGIRKEELTNIKGNDFIYNEIEQKHFLYVRGKGRKDRYIEISDSHMEEIKQLENYGISKYLFPNNRGDKMTGTNVSRILKKYRDIQVHDLRRTFATNLVDRGISLAELQYELGHENINTTKIYFQNANKFKQNLNTLVEW